MTESWNDGVERWSNGVMQGGSERAKKKLEAMGVVVSDGRRAGGAFTEPNS